MLKRTWPFLFGFLVLALASCGDIADAPTEVALAP
jgi:hypothetical protein